MEPYELLEQRLGEWIGNPNVVVCSSGTAALHLAVETLRPPEGGDLIVPEFTIVSCARAASLCGSRPVFADCDDRLLMTPETIERVMRRYVWGVMPVHIYGRRCNMDAIRRMLHGFVVIEDMAEAHGVKPHPDSDAACYSFYQNKIVHGEEGGAVVFKRAEDAEVARSLRCIGLDDHQTYMHRPGGMNYRLPNLLATPILDSLDQVEDNLRWRDRVAAMYDDAMPEEWKMPPRDVVWVYDFRVPGLTAKEQLRVVRALNGLGIRARRAFQPMTLQQEFYKTTHGENALRLSREVMYFHVSPDDDESVVAANVAALRGVL